MPDRKIREELPENEQPVNRLSKQAIIKLGETPDSGQAYFLRLIHLVLERGLLRVLDGRRIPCGDLLDNLHHMPPERLQDFLGRAEDEEGQP